MKRSLFAALALASVSLSACATTSAGGPPPIVSPAAKVDAKAIGAETAVTALAVALQVYVSDPAVDVDRGKLRVQVIKAAGLLVQGRMTYDARSGSPAVLAGQAMGLISAALPADAPITARAALMAAQAAIGIYTIGLGGQGVAVEPSAELVQARKTADEAVRVLLINLPPPET